MDILYVGIRPQGDLLIQAGQGHVVEQTRGAGDARKVGGIVKLQMQLQSARRVDTAHHARTYSRISCIRCSGSSFPWPEECDLAGLVNHAWVGAVMGGPLGDSEW